MDSHEYINDQNQGYHSPALSASRLDNHYEYDFTAPSPNLPQTPSYNGSYQNSPYSPYSDLEFEGTIALEGPGDYDPTDFDAPSNNPPSLLNFMNPPHVSLAPPMDGFDHSYDHGSPASSNGIPDQESESRSRASSVSSHSRSHYPSSPPIRDFDLLGFESPRWNPAHLPVDKPGSPSLKPPSPPSLVIPDVSPSMNSENLHTRAPLINAPQGDGGVINGPQLHIVPATPVSGGLPTTIPFINNPAESTFYSPSIPHSFLPFVPNASIISTFPIASTPSTWNTEAAPQNLSFDTRISSDFSNSQSNSLDHYLTQQQTRSRSKSDTSSRPPTWDVPSLDPSSNNRTSVNPNDILPSTSPQPQGQISFSTDSYQSGFSNPSSHPGLLGHYSFAGKSHADSQFLSPDMALTATSLRRARSDSGRVGHRLSRSESGISYPPSAHTDFIARAAGDNLNAMKQQFLHPTEVVPSIRGHHRRSSSGSRDRGIGGMGLHSAPGSSRASPYPSPNASPLLGYDSLPPIPSIQSLPPPTSMGRGRPVSMPAYGASTYGIPPGGIGELSQQINAGSNLSDIGSTLNGGSVHGVNSSATVVSKPNVTTSATAEASERRRKTDANFACPVPGCGSTFTRHFNLKGVLCRRLRGTVLTRRSRSYAFAQRGETIPVQVARVWKRVC